MTLFGGDRRLQILERLVGTDSAVLDMKRLCERTVGWVAFTGPAVEAGVRAVFGFPLQGGAVRLGALNLYRDRPGPLSDAQYGDALIVADITAQAVLLAQADASPGTLAETLETNSNFNYVVHQASGMVAAQLGSTVGQALVRLRAYAFGNDQSLTTVANRCRCTKIAI